MPHLKVIVAEGIDPRVGNIIMLHDKITIGRALNNTVTIEDLNISRIHCEISPIDGIYYLTDKSTNGILVNGMKISTNTLFQLKNRNIIEISKNKFQYLHDSNATESDAVYIDDMVIDLVEEDDDIEIIADAEAIDALVAEAVVVLDESVAAGGPPPAAANNSQYSKFADELTCSICVELFVNAITLNCQHAFCETCIITWQKSNRLCPICRQLISASCPSLVINNMVELVVAKFTPEEKAARTEVVNQRKAELAAAAQPPRGARAERGARGRGRAAGRARPSYRHHVLSLLHEEIQNHQEGYDGIVEDVMEILERRFDWD